MIDSSKFMQELIKLGVTRGAGVPCSFLSGLVNAAINERCYENFNNEGDALAFASGWSIGKKDQYGFCLMQNSGLSNALSPLTSLNPQFKIPVLLFISWRGEPGVKDEPQHSIMGPKLREMLDAAECNYDVLAADYENAICQVQEAINYMKIEKKPYALIIRKGTFDKVPIEIEERAHLPSRAVCLRIIDRVATYFNAPVICTTGQTGRQLHDLHDSDNYLYMVGSMGCGQALAAGLSESMDKRVIFVDGDGALLMRLGSCANLGYLDSNVVHIILDNGSYNTTGRQSCISNSVDFKDTLSGLGYEDIYEFDESNLYEFEDRLKKSMQKDTLTAIIIYISNKEITDLGRPTRSPEQKLIDFRGHYGISK